MIAPRSIRARLALAALAIVALVMLAYAALPRLLAGWVERALAARGFADPQVDLGYPGLHGIRVHRLQLARTAAGQSFELSVRDLDIGYEPAALLAGRVQSLRIADASLKVAPSARESPDRTGTLPAPGDWVAAFPLDTLVVGNLRIEQRPPNGKAHVVNLQGEVQHAESRLQSRWSLRAAGKVLLRFDLDLTAGGELAAALYSPGEPDRPVLRATQTFSPAAGGRIALSGSLEADLRPLAPLVSPWLVLPATIVPLDGRVRANWGGESVASAAPAVISGTLHLEATTVRVGTILQNGQLLLDAEVTQEGDRLSWHIGKGLRLAGRLDPVLLALTKPPGGGPPEAAPEPLVLTAPRGLHGTWSRGSAGSRLTVESGAELVLTQVHTPEISIPSLTAKSARTAQFDYESGTGRWQSDGLALALNAPVIDTRLAALGRIEDVALRARFDSGPVSAHLPVTLDAIVLRLLGGQVQGNSLRIAPGHDSPPFTVRLDQIDLARVVALERQQEIEATGRLDGELPITLTRRGVRIADGWLKATGPGGVIRYHPGTGVTSMAQANPNLNLVLNALSNYHYDTLKVGVNYAENGDLALAVAMTGRNPDWNAGQPINLNINVDENVPMLLRSLRIAGEVGGAVERRMQRDKPKR